LLEDAFVLRQIEPLGTNVLKEPKILLRVPYQLLELDYEDAIGGLREDFATECLLNAGLSFGYLKTNTGRKTPDYMIKTNDGPVVVEIGGKGKGVKQFKGIDNNFRKLVFADTSELSPHKLPLALLGLLEEGNRHA